MKKVLHLTLFLDIGGLERMILLLCRGQKAAGLSPRVFVYGRDTAELLPQFERENIPVIFAAKKPGFSPRLPFWILATLRAEGISVIHSHDLGALLYASLVRLLSFGRIRIVHTQHSFQHLVTAKARLYERIFPWLASVVVCVSEDLRRTYLSLGQPFERLRVVPNGVDFGAPAPTGEERRRARLALLERHGLPASLANLTWVITLGRLAPIKGPQHAMRVWRSADTGGAALFCVGPGAEAGFLAELKREAAANVYFTGPTLDPRSWLVVADLFLSASEFEGMPLAGLEAAAAGLPMLLSEIPGHGLFRGWAAFFPLADPLAGGAQLERFFTDHSFGEGTGDASTLDRLALDCGTDRMTESYLKIYGEL